MQNFRCTYAFDRDTVVTFMLQAKCWLDAFWTAVGTIGQEHGDDCIHKMVGFSLVESTHGTEQ